MEYNRVITELKELINSNTDYSLIDGLQILERFTSEQNETDKLAFINWLELNFSFDNITRKEYKSLNDNFEFYRTINYFIEDKSFNYETAVKWLESAKRSILDDIHTIKIKEGILKPLQLLNEKEKVNILKKEKNIWFEKFKDIIGTDNFNPLNENQSINELLSWRKVSKKSSLLCILPYPSFAKTDYNLLPSQQFRDIVYPSLQAHHIFNWINEQIENSGKPKENLNLNIEELFKKQSEYQYIRQILIENNHINSVTNIWIDSKKGNLAFLVCLIKSLFPLGYLKQKPTHKQIQIIAKNSFKIDIGMDTIKKTKEFSIELPNIKPINN